MAIFLPPAVSVSKFTGGYKKTSDYTDLADTETNDAQNVFYGLDYDLQKRAGSERLYNVALPGSITGHYYFEKQGSTSKLNIVACVGNLYNYTSATASIIRSGLNSGSETYWNFIQLQDPRSAADDMVLGTNGINPIQVWNGTGTATLLNTFTSQCDVPICNILVGHKRRVFGLNIEDSADADASVKVVASSFGNDGNPDPHRFLYSFYCGGSSREGGIQNAAILHDQLVIYTRKSTWKFTPGAGSLLDTSLLQQLEAAYGLYAPASLVDGGGFHLYLSEQGVIYFDGINFKKISDNVDAEIFEVADQSLLSKARGVYDRVNQRYILYFAEAGSLKKNRAIVFDMGRFWQPPITGRNVSFVSTFVNKDGMDAVIYGDHYGYLYEDDVGGAEGIAIGFNGVVTSASTATLLCSGAAFPTSDDGLRGRYLTITDGPAAGFEAIILSNTSETLTLEKNFTDIPTSASTFSVGGINSYWRSKDYDFTGHDITKIFRHVSFRIREEGNYSTRFHYIVDFNKLSQSTYKDLIMYEDAAIYGISRYSHAKYGRRKNFDAKVSLRSTPDQSNMGNHLAIRLSNPGANRTFRVSGFDIELKSIGKR